MSIAGPGLNRRLAHLAGCGGRFRPPFADGWVLRCGPWR
jgi:hypothetical protein